MRANVQIRHTYMKHSQTLSANKYFHTNLKSTSAYQYRISLSWLARIASQPCGLIISHPIIVPRNIYCMKTNVNGHFGLILGKTWKKTTSCTKSTIISSLSTTIVSNSLYKCNHLMPNLGFSPSYVAAQPNWVPTSARWGRSRRSSGCESPAVPRQGRNDG